MRINALEEIAYSMKTDLFRENIVKMIYRIATGALALGLCGGTILAIGALATEELPPLQTYGGVSYVSGGVGLDESTAVKAAAKDFTLSLLFVQTKRGEYLADVKVSIRDKEGALVLEAVSDGPMLLARLPAGLYKISAEHEGTALVKTVRVDSKRVTQAAFVWQPAAKATIE
jgi:hypothetical protein